MNATHTVILCKLHHGRPLHCGRVLIGEAVDQRSQKATGATDAAESIFGIEEHRQLHGSGLGWKHRRQIARRAGRLRFAVGEIAHQGLHKEGGFDRLREPPLHAERETALELLGHGVGRHREDGKGCKPGLRAESERGCVTVHHRHLEVHQHHIKGRLLGTHFQQLAGCGAMRSDSHDGACLLEHLAGNLLVDGVVFHQQDAERGERIGALEGAAYRRGVPPRGEEGGERIDHRRARDRLLQHQVDRPRSALAADVVDAMRGDENDGRILGQRVCLAQPSRGLHAVEPRHAPVDEDDIVGLSL